MSRSFASSHACSWQIEVRECREGRCRAARISYAVVRLRWKQWRDVHGEASLRYLGVPDLGPSPIAECQLL